LKSRPNEILIEYYYCHTANAVLGYVGGLDDLVLTELGSGDEGHG